MKTIITIHLLLSICYIIPAVAQVDVISPVVNGQSYAISIMNNVYYSQLNSDYLSSYNGLTISRFDFPIRAGSRLRYHPFNNEMAVRGADLYMVLHNVERYDSMVLDTERYLYRFNDGTYEPITLPGKPVSNPVVYQDKIFILIQIGGETKLFWLEGSTYMEVSSSEIPLDPYFNLKTAGQYLISIGYGNGPINMKRFDGTNIITVPFVTNWIRIRSFNIKAISGTEELYIHMEYSTPNYYQLFYFDGAVVREYSDGSDRIEVLNNRLHFLSAGSNISIFEYGEVVRTVEIPDGGQRYYRSNTIVFRNKLYFTARYREPERPGTRKLVVYEFDGFTFNSVMEFTDEIVRMIFWGEPYVRIDLYKREDDFIIYGNLGEIQRFNIYDGTTLSSLAPPRSRTMKYLTSASCFHFWETFSYTDTIITDYTLAKEIRSCNPGYSITPDHVRRFERADFRLYGNYRDWCWSDIIWDWEIDPQCPFCPEPRFEASMTDVKGNVAWSEQFEKPFQAKIQLPDYNLYNLALSSVSEKTTQNLFLFDDDLVPQGIASFNISMIPDKEYFHLKVETDYEKEIPFMMYLLDEKGETIWKEVFKAPFDDEISARVATSGSTIQFSSIPDSYKKQEASDNISMNFYPNPFPGKFTVDIGLKDKKEIPMELTVSDLYGHIILKKQIIAPAQETINLIDHKSGIYILKLKSADTTLTKQIKLER